MVQIYNERMTAELDDEVVVFLIGMRINKLWKVNKWWPVTRAMPRMLNELYANSELGLISHESWFGRTSIMMQYWRSFEHLENYARNKTGAHLPAWAEFNKHVGSKGDVGIWHETYLVKKGAYECIYNNMPQFGLGRVGRHVPAAGNRKSASDRFSADPA